MKNHVNQFVSNAWRTFPAKCVLATIGLTMISVNCTAQGTQTIEVQGKDSTWNLVGTVAPMTGFQIQAKGKVDFGGVFCHHIILHDVVICRSFSAMIFRMI